MTKEETLTACREKWATLPTEEEAWDWWEEVGKINCALCYYMHDSVWQTDKCYNCPFATNGEPCHSAWNKIHNMYCDCDWDYSIFKENFLLMQAAVNALTPDDLPDEENDNA